jgi:glucosamine-6-phosphate deaminase
MVCLGIGENGHLAFNDPPVANFDDPKILKKVELDLTCRQQQVNDGMFATLNDVPEYAMTLTIPSLFKAKILHCMVPGKTKSKAIYSTIHDEISTKCPSTLLRKHHQCSLYVDRDSMSLSA